jgi:hypothetical protein
MRALRPTNLILIDTIALVYIFDIILKECIGTRRNAMATTYILL